MYLVHSPYLAQNMRLILYITIYITIYITKGRIR